jgi:signal transduction histidine kinase
MASDIESKRLMKAQHKLSLLKAFKASIMDNNQGSKNALNVLLLGSFSLAFIAFIASGLHQFSLKGSLKSGSPLLSLSFCLIIAGLFWISKRISYIVSAYILISLFLLAGSYAIYRWGINIPIGLLIFGLVISMSGILINSRATIVMTATISVIIALIGLLHSSNILHPDTSWRTSPTEAGDAITFIAIFSVISLISMLSNQEINKSLRNARDSENQLRDERNKLEERVSKRTKQMEKLQREKIIQLQRFAEFGRISASLVHDISNPLMVASIRLEQLSASKSSKLIEEAMESINWLSKYIDAARRQYQREGEVKVFKVSDELNQAIGIVSYKAHKQNVKIESHVRTDAFLEGDPIKCNRIIVNIITNAIDSYSLRKPDDKDIVSVSITQKGSQVILCVEDWGVGIEQNQIIKVFEPFHGVKQSPENMGLGLSLVRKSVEEDFKGSIKVISSRKSGTKFFVYFPSRIQGH